MSENYPAHERLDSWKEIAAYLNRDVRTAIRWEKERGLPVRRVPGGHKQAVFAYREEIDAWLVGRSENGEHPRRSELAPPAPAPATAPVENTDTLKAEPIPAGFASRSSLRIGFLLSPWTLLVVAGVIATLAFGIRAAVSRGSAPNSVRVDDFDRITDDGSAKFYLRTDGKTLYFAKTEGARMVLASAPVSGGPSSIIETPFPNVAVEDLSNDGSRLLVLSYKSINIESELWTVPLQGGAPARVSDIRCHAARWSPDNRKIACAYRTAIIVMDADGSDLHTVGSFASPVEQMVWSPDGMRLRYVLLDAAPQTYSQWEMTFDGNGNAGPPERLDFGPHCCADWNWSADGKTFVMAEFGANGRSRLKIRNGPSSSTVELPVNIGRTWAIAPGKQDHTIYLVIGTPFRSELLEFNGGKGTLQNLRPGFSAEYLSYSRDGQWMSYTDPVSGPLWRSRADGSDPLQLMKPPMEAIVSAWSPDGQRIAFMGNEPGKPSRIYLIGRDGGEIEEASDGGDNQGGPSWSPDGREIVYGNVYCEQTQDCFVRRINLSTRKSEIIPDSQGMVTARWSPDGKYIAALRFMTRELMLYDLRSKIWEVLADSIDGNNVNWSSDSRYIYVDSPRGRNPVVERVRVADGRRNTVLSLNFFKDVPGQLSPWVGLTPDNSPIFSRMLTASEVYKLKWSDR